MSFHNGHFIHLVLKEATLQSLLVHHPVVVLLCLQDACIHLAGHTGHKIIAISLQSQFTWQHQKEHGQKGQGFTREP